MNEDRNRVELYNINNDCIESQNLADEASAKVGELIITWDEGKSE